MYNHWFDTFLRVADAGSFNKAAEESFITPTAVIKQINLLEAELGVRLFERTHRGLTLTKAGKSLYQDTKYIIQYRRDSITRAKNAMQDDTSIIRIGTSPMTPAQLLMQLWSKIQARCLSNHSL
ncbi:HTH-type transcriptional regulator TfdS [Clostridiales bacterium]|nr:HTH-type transcriptional regulator TfdS [Clostridiales bacterium]